MNTSIPSNPETAINRIERLARRDPGDRGLAACAGTNHLYPAAADLLTGTRVVLVTGFCIRAAMIGETDGPSGTLALADALRRLGKEVVLVTDRFSEGLLTAGATVFGAPFTTVVLSQSQEEADSQIRTLLDTFAPTHVVAIERPGSAADGHRYSMRGEILDDLVPAADSLINPPFPRAFRTIAIGDGGNELGLGGLREALKERITHGELIFCSTVADYMIPAGISNWGAFACVAALSVLSGRPLLKPAGNEYAVLQAMCAAGAVDGCTRKNEISVDGQSWEDYAATISDILAVADSALTAKAIAG